MTWSGFFTVSGWLVGIFSAIWGVRQTNRANEADRREVAVRSLLHRRKGVQLVLGLLEGCHQLHVAVEIDERKSLRTKALAAAAEMTRAVSFFGVTPSESIAAKLQSSRETFSSAVQTIAIDTLGDFGDRERETLRTLFLEAEFNLQAIRGELEMIDDLGNDALRMKD